MNKSVENEIVRLGGDPADAIWIWLVQRGPHGPSITWGPSLKQPAGYVGVVHLEEIVAEQAATTPDFRAHARQVVQMGLKSNLAEVVLRSIQAAAIVGHDEELEQIRPLTRSGDDTIAAHAKACVFYMKNR